MLLVPAWVWRGGFVYRAVCIGVPTGVVLAALVFAESGILLGALVAFVVLSTFYGIVMARRMGKFWPAGQDLSAGDRVAVVGAARRGHDIDDARVAPAAIDYSNGLREAHAQARQWHWMVWLGAAAVLALAIVDSLSGTPRLAVVSWFFVAFFVVELFWWPRRENQLLINAERTERSGRRAISEKR